MFGIFDFVFYIGFIYIYFLSMICTFLRRTGRGQWIDNNGFINACHFDFLNCSLRFLTSAWTLVASIESFLISRAVGRSI